MATDVGMDIDPSSDSDSTTSIDNILQQFLDEHRPSPVVFDDDGPIQFPADLADENNVGVQADLNLHDDPPLQEQPPAPLKLSYLKESFDLRHHSTAIADLMGSKRIVIDDKYTLDRSHYYSDLEQMMTLKVQDFYLDFTMYVGLLPGLGAIMPTPEADHSWVFVMNLKNQSRNFRPKHSWTGFDVNGRMIDIGTVRGREHVWIAFAPDALVSGEKEMDPPFTGNSVAPHVTKAQYRKFLLFLAMCLSEMRFGDIYCIDPYADVKEPSEFERSTNILVHLTHDLNVTHVKTLDLLMRKKYPDWVNHMPASFSEPLFRDNSPITISYHYGQDSPLRVVSTFEEAGVFRREHDMKYVRTWSTALAVHLRHAWSPSGMITMQGDIPQSFQKPPYYDSWDPVHRYEIPQEDIESGNHRPVDINTGDINHLYNADGWHIPRVSFLDQEALPALFDLAAMQRLYNDSNTGHNPTFYRYPLANLHSYGNFQAKGPMGRTQRMFAQLNRDIDGRPGVLSGRHPPRTAILAGGSQGYNLLSHRKRHGAKYHDAQLALLLAAMGGSLRRGVVQNRKFEALLEKLKAGLPHQIFEHKIKDLEGECCDLRLEDVIHINLSMLKREQRDAGWIYLNILAKWMDQWYHGEMLHALQQATIVFRSEAFPNLFLWTAWPLCAAMEKLFEFTSLERERTWERHMTRFHHLELMSYLSRLWNFNQTGDLRVIPYKVFKAFRVYKQFLKTNWVSFKNIATFDLIPRDDRPMLALSPHRIPIDPETGKPILSADSSLAYHYDAKMGQLYRAYADVCIQTMSLPTSWKDHWPAIQRHLHRIAYISLLEFQKSVVDLVTKWVESDIKRATRSHNTPEEMLHSIRRAADVRVWAKKKKPLSYEDNTYEVLTQAIHEDPRKVADGLPASDPRQMSLAEFATLLARMGVPSNPAQLGPPIEKSSPYIYTLRSCVALFFSLAGSIDDKTKIALFVNHATELCAELGINYIPWSEGYFPPSGKTSGIGRCNRDVVPTKWITLGAPAPPLILPRNMLTPHQAIGVALSHSRLESMRGHPAAAWSVSELVLRDLGSFLDRRIKPTDWSLAHARLPDNKDDLVTCTYNWVNDNLDLHNPVHHVTFLTAIIIAKALPTVAYRSGAPTAEPAQQAGDRTRESVLTELVCQVPWIDGGRGTHQLEPFLVMFVVGFLAWKEQGSPLRVYYREHSGVGTTWSSKHRKKFITPVNFVRCRLAVVLGSGLGIFSSPKHGQNWKCMDDASLILRHQVLLATFQGRMGAHGIYCLLHEMFGHDIAVKMSRSEGVNYPDHYEDRIRPPPLEEIIAGGGAPPLPSHLPPQPPSNSHIEGASTETKSHKNGSPSLDVTHQVKNVQKRPNPSTQGGDLVAAAKRPKHPEPKQDKGKGKAIISSQSRQFTQPNAEASSSRVTLDHLRAPHVHHGRGSGSPKRPRESYLTEDGKIDWDLVTHEDIDWTTRVGIDGILYDREHKPEEYRLVGTPYANLVDWYMF